MDLFYEELPIKKRNVCTFTGLCGRFIGNSSDFQGEPNPLKKVAASFAGQARVICFDEFFVSDITDAMLLAGLLDEMFRLGVTLVATSNVEPDHLYENGLQRRKFSTGD